LLNFNFQEQRLASTAPLTSRYSMRECIVSLPFLIRFSSAFARIYIHVSLFIFDIPYFRRSLHLLHARTTIASLLGVCTVPHHSIAFSCTALDPSIPKNASSLLAFPLWLLDSL
jgi:hypothetical protein